MSLDLLVVAPHPDDAEISVGGILLSSADRGWKTGVVDLTSGEPTPHGSVELREEETAAASKVLNLSWRRNLGLPNRSLEPNLDARRKLAEVFRQTRPRVILAPYWDDAHPDHVAANRLADAARFWAKLSRSDLEGDPFWPPNMLYYWSVHLRNHPSPAVVIDVSDVIDRKLQAVRCYASQVQTGRSSERPTFLDDIEDRARYWGWSIHRRYAEPLAAREEIGVSDLAHVLI